MIAALDLAAVVVVCITTIICFVIRSNWVSSIDEIHDGLDEVLDVPEALRNLREVVTSNALVSERIKLDVDRLKAEAVATRTRGAMGGK